jgi:drug/metabolite transporter (DMT)-like permease
MVWVTLLYAILVAGCFRFLQRGARSRIATPTRRLGIVARLMSYGSPRLVIWALALAPMALVSALRETSIVFAVIIGVVFLQERLSLTRLASITTTLVGTTILKLSR